MEGSRAREPAEEGRARFHRVAPLALLALILFLPAMVRPSGEGEPGPSGPSMSLASVRSPDPEPTRAHPVGGPPRPRTAPAPPDFPSPLPALRSEAEPRWRGFLSRALARARERGIPLETISFRVLLPDGGVIGHRDEVTMAPASTLKIATAAFALDLLGSSHLLRTDLLVDGPVIDGVLQGSVIVVGHGDPATSSRAFPDDPVAELRPWVAALRARGIERIAGGLIADDRHLAGPGRRREWPADQLDRWYCAPSGALNLNDNCVDVLLDSQSGEPTLTLRPPSPLFTIASTLRGTAARKEHRYRVDRPGDEWRIVVAGKFLRGVGERVHWVTVPDPTQAFLGAFAELLRSEGIAVEGGLGRGVAPEGATRVARIEHSVASTLPVLLKNSQNLYGDALLRVTGRESGGDGSFDRSGALLTLYAQRSLHGPSGLAVLDGSGLARQNRVDCATLVEVLRRADSAEWGPIFWEALPIAGRDGTLEKRFRGSPLVGRLRGKTGHISGVSGLAGGWQSDAGPVRFAALTGGKGVKVSAFKSWWEETLGELDTALLSPEPSGR
jgi:D-alanyl-D-alanine carboxypeptidase/D-alanyl-D-alanine-endopeptidase (penicillin-binding protein 4)